VRLSLARAAWAAALVVACNSTVPTPAPSPTSGAVVTPFATPSAVATPLAVPTATPSPIATVSEPPTSSPSETGLPSQSPSPTPQALPYLIPGCKTSLPAGWSVARLWDETALDLIRANPPAPTIVARNLFDLSAVMWDAWAAYDTTAVGYFSTEKHTAEDVPSARAAAISFAAFDLLVERYFPGADATYLPPEMNAPMTMLCYRVDQTIPDGSPAYVGATIARIAIDAGKNDGSLENEGYVDSTFHPVNSPLLIYKPGTTMKDPNQWQPLQFPRGKAEGQGGRPAPQRQTFIGAQWGYVTPFALPTPVNGMAIDPGPPPALGSDATLDDEYKQAAIALLTYSATLDPSDGVTEDISPASLGNNDVGTNDGTGRAINPSTGQPYQPEVVLRADYERALAEFWADGPNSETPPGHWNLIANHVADSPGFEFRFAGGTVIPDRLEWDVKMYFALNGALHDAAIAAWGVKRVYDTARPISMIRYLSEKGQSSDPSLPDYDPEGIPLVPGLVEVITQKLAAKGQRFYALRDHIGEIAVRAWRGFPKDPTTQTSGVGWILGIDWVPYQRPTFVTPSFPGYISGHSTFSRAAAEVLVGLTGSEYFPGGLYTWPITQGSLRHELGPTASFSFEWATYYDAADAAGMSRQYMGIHISEDDFAGRVVGSTVGTAAWALAQRYFEGTAPTAQR
jgi:hypothetical protein